MSGCKSLKAKARMLLDREEAGELLTMQDFLALAQESENRDNLMLLLAQYMAEFVDSLRATPPTGDQAYSLYYTEQGVDGA